MKAPSQVYRDWLRTGIRLFDEPKSVLLPNERINSLHIADLEVAAEMLSLDWRRYRQCVPDYRPRHA